jgi:site-specific DNA recombinase
MPSTNGHKKTALLYTRVSGDKQRDHGYSLSDQRRELEAWAAREGYDVLEVIEDGAWSGASLVRPGLDELRELVAAGGVDAVVTLFRDRLARGVYAGLLAEEFAEYGCKLIALNTQVDDSPEGELHGGMLDIIANWERKKIAERTRRGKLQKARQGKVIANHSVNYGFRLNAERDGYIVDERDMEVVRRIFYQVGAQGQPMYAVKRNFEREGLPSPTGKRSWSPQFIRKVIQNDVYRPHTFEEIEKLVAPEVAARLDPNKRYGIWWWGRQRHVHKQVVESKPIGERRYRKTRRTHLTSPEKWIAVPVPDSGVPRTWVDAAREAIKSNLRAQSSGLRFWELAGFVRCGGCGRQMSPLSVLNSRKRRYFYYHCSKRKREGKDACPNKSRAASSVESEVWAFVSSVMKDPEQLRDDLERMIELQREGVSGDPEREAKVWLEKLSKVERLRSAYQDQQAEGLITLDELRAKLSSLEETRTIAQRELEALRGRRERIEELERNKEAILEHYARIAPEALDSLIPEERHHLYGMLGLEVVIHPPPASLEVILPCREASFVSDFETASTLRSGKL